MFSPEHGRCGCFAGRRFIGNFTTAIASYDRSNALYRDRIGTISAFLKKRSHISTETKRRAFRYADVRRVQSTAIKCFPSLARLRQTLYGVPRGTRMPCTHVLCSTFCASRRDGPPPPPQSSLSR